MPDTRLEAGFTAGSQSRLTELPGKQVISMQCVGSVLPEQWLGEVVMEGFLEEWAPKLGSKG